MSRRLTDRELRLCRDALAVWSADYNDAPHGDIESVRVVLQRKLDERARTMPKKAKS